MTVRMGLAALAASVPGYLHGRWDTLSVTHRQIHHLGGHRDRHHLCRGDPRIDRVLPAGEVRAPARKPDHPPASPRHLGVNEGRNNALKG
eukprot:scaffold51357_cov17-Prasinocladus_malaysianus.AAC.1